MTSNPTVIDGQVTATVGINLGFSVTLAGDVNPRDVGAQLADVITPVSCSLR